MELVRLRSLADPSFTCAPTDLRTPAFQYQPSESIKDGSQPPRGSSHDAAATKASPPPLTPVLLSNPANFAALRCDWPHPAVRSLLLAQGMPGMSLPGQGLPGLSPPLRSQPAGLWDRMLPALSTQQYPGQVAQLQSLSSLLRPNGDSGQHTVAGNLPQPKVCVGFQEDWLELSPAMLPLWPTAPFEPYAGPKPVQYFVLCPEELESKALLFVKDVGAMYELCNLGSSHPAAQVPWLYTFSTAHPPGSPSPDSHSQAQQAWDRLPQRERYLLGLRAAAERLQRALLTSPLQLHQEGPALELNPGASPVVYVVCPLGAEGLEGCLEEALLEAACCLAPCTPLGFSASQSSRPSANSGSSSVLCSTAVPVQPPGEPATPDPSSDRHAGISARVGDGSQAVATPMETDVAGEAAGVGGREDARQLYQGAADRLFQQEAGNCGQVAQQEFPRGDGVALDLVLQVIGPHCYSDASGQAATALAFELYLKIWRQPPDPDAVLQHGSSAAKGLACTAPPLMHFCSEPLFTLAPNRSLAEQHVSAPPLPSSPRRSVQQQQQQQQLQHGSPDILDLLSSPYPSPPNLATTPAPIAEDIRTLHCCYALPDDLAACTVCRMRAHAAPASGATESSCRASRQHADLPQAEAAGSSSMLLVPVAWTDSCGELLHCEILEVDLQQGACTERHSTSGVGSLVISNPGGSSRAQEWGDAAWGLVVGHVAQRSTELLQAFCSASHPRNALQAVVFTRVGAMHSAEQAAWEQLLSRRAAGVVAGSFSHKMAVVMLQVETSKRLGTPSSLPGGWRVVSEQHGQQGTSATVLLLPGDDPALLTLPGEHDTVRLLRLDLVASGGTSGEGSEHLGQQQAVLELVQELSSLALLNAAHYSLLYGSCTAPAGLRVGTGPPVAAHLPFHAALASRLLSLVLLAGRRGSGG